MQWGLELESNTKQRERVKQIKQFNPHDLKKDEFITAGQAWKLCRQGLVDPMKFGIDCTIRPEWKIDSLHGLWFVRGQLLRDFAALNKVEIVPYLVRICKGVNWKSWNLLDKNDEEVTEEELELLDLIAKLTCNPDDNMEKIWELYSNNRLLSVPNEIIKRM